MISFISYMRLRRYEASSVGDLACNMVGEAEMAVEFPLSYITCDPVDLRELVQHVPSGYWDAAARAWSDYCQYRLRQGAAWPTAMG